MVVVERFAAWPQYCTKTLVKYFEFNFPQDITCKGSNNKEFTEKNRDNLSWLLQIL